MLKADDRLAKAFQDVFEHHESGKYVLTWLMDFCGFWEVGNPTDVNLLQFQNGQRNVILQILSILDYKGKDVFEVMNQSKQYQIKEESNDNY